MPASEVPGEFEAIKNRLEEIVNLVGNDDLPLDDALDLYEEAIALGMRVSDAIEEGIIIDEQKLEEPFAQAQTAETTADAGDTGGGNGADDAASNNTSSAQPDKQNASVRDDSE